MHVHLVLDFQQIHTSALWVEVNIGSGFPAVPVDEQIASCGMMLKRCSFLLLKFSMHGYLQLCHLEVLGDVTYCCF